MDIFTEKFFFELTGNCDKALKWSDKLDTVCHKIRLVSAATEYCNNMKFEYQYCIVYFQYVLQSTDYVPTTDTVQYGLSNQVQYVKCGRNGKTDPARDRGHGAELPIATF